MAKPKTKGEMGAVRESRTIQSVPLVVTKPEVNFDWGPKLIAYTLQVGGNTYPWEANQPVQGAADQADIHRTAALQELTFTANVRVPEGDFISEYEWDFGDGEKGYGEVATHTYTTPSPSTRTRLCVTDNHGRRFCIGKPMNLYAADLTLVGGFALVNPPIYLYGDTTSGSVNITNLSSTSDLSTGMRVSGDGIQPDTTVASIVSATEITISLPATATATAVELLFEPVA